MANDDKLKQIVTRSIAPFLKSKGFKKRGLLWNRDAGSFVHYIGVQKSPWNNATTCKFTVNVGLHIKPLSEIMSNTSIPDFITEFYCYPNFRIGELIHSVDKPFYDIWWTLGQDTPIEPVENELLAIFCNNISPFFEKCCSIPDIINFVLSKPGSLSYQSPYGKISLAVLYYLSGDEVSCYKMLEQFESSVKRDKWKQTAAQVRERLHQSAKK